MRAYRRPESVLVVVYTSEGEVLLLRRVEPPDFWQCVTGSLHWDETPAQAARRELKQETGITATGIEDRGTQRSFEILPAWRARFAPDVARNLEHEFALCLPEPVTVYLNPGEHRECRWLPWRQACARSSSWTNREAIGGLFIGDQP